MEGTYIQAASDDSERIVYIIDYLLNSVLENYRQMMINYEQGTYIGNGKFRYTYQNWNPGFEPEIFLNGGSNLLDKSHYEIDMKKGVITTKFDAEEGDHLLATYNFDYFPEWILKSYIIKAVSTINTAGQGTPTEYTIDDAPTNWDGVISDLVSAMCMEKLLLDYDLWKGRLLFAIGSDSLLSGSGGDVTNQLSTLKRNYEERAYKTMDNPKFRTPNALARPTRFYYQSLLIGSGPRVSPHGYSDYGKLRGIKFNKIIGTGMTGAAGV